MKLPMVSLAVVALTFVGCTVNQLPPQEPSPPRPAAPAAQAPIATPAPAPAPAPGAPAPGAPAPAPGAPAPASAAPASAPTSQPAFAETPLPPPADAPQILKFSVADGRPKGLRAGAPEAFWVWHDSAGKRWHLRSTTHAQDHRFHGSVVPDSGYVTKIQATRAEWGDRVRVNKGGISFDFHTHGDEDGFDFETSGQCVRFYLMIDGKPHPAFINIGSGNAHPPAWHFKLCP